MGCERIFEDKGISGAVRARPGLDDALAALQAGDVLVVWRLDRLARSLADLLAVVDGLRQQGCGFRSLTESIDTVFASSREVYFMETWSGEAYRELVATAENECLAEALVVRASDLHSGGQEQLPAVPADTKKR